MTKPNIIYVAINKETKDVINGVNGQYAYGTVGNLRKSMTHRLRWLAKSKGVKASELYSVLEIDVATLLPKEDE